MTDSENTSASPTKKKRGRPPKNNVVETNSVNSESETVNESCSFHTTSTNGSYFGTFNIFDYYTPEQLSALVRDPMSHNAQLRELSLILYGTSGIFTNSVDYMTAMPTLDKVIVPHGKNITRRKRNKELMESTLRTIKDKEIIRDALWRGMIEGIAFYYFETSGRPNSLQKLLTDFDVDRIAEINEFGMNAGIISLPADYTEIVGIKNNSYVIAFNLDYFDSVNGETTEKKLKKYPKEIRDAYESRRNGTTSNGNWIVLDNNKTIVHKIRSSRSEKYGRPLVLAAISDILYGDYFTQTKRNVLDEINNKVVVQCFPEGRDKGSCALTKQQQETQHNTVKNAILNKNGKGHTSFVSVSAGTVLKAIDVANTEIFDSKNESNLSDTIALDLGIAASLLNGSSTSSYSSQNNNLSLLSSQIFQWIAQIESELNKCISANIIKDNVNWCEVRYLPITYVNKEEMISSAKDLYLSAGGSVGLWSAACGIPSDVFLALCDEERDSGIYDRLTPHQTAYTLSKGDSKAGRPTDDNSKNPNTLQSKANDSNNVPKPSTK